MFYKEYPFDSIHLFWILHCYLHSLNQTEIPLISNLSQPNQFLNEYAHYVEVLWFIYMCRLVWIFQMSRKWTYTVNQIIQNSKRELLLFYLQSSILLQLFLTSYQLGYFYVVTEAPLVRELSLRGNVNMYLSLITDLLLLFLTYLSASLLVSLTKMMVVLFDNLILIDSWSIEGL